MEEQQKNRIAPTRPKDKSLEAYKIWIRELMRQFTTSDAAIQLTEGEWRENWQEYWKEHPNNT